MKKFKLIAVAVALLAAGTAMAQTSYNRVGVSYDNTTLSAKGEDSRGLNGFGVSYIHGFGLTESMPLYLEVGGKLNMGFWSKDYEGEKSKLNMMTLSVPVNVTYKYAVNEDFAIAPYLGLNFKYNLTAKEKEGDGESVSMFDKDKMGDDGTWNRFQMGWHVGVGFQYKPYYLGISWGTDFINVYKHEDYKISSSNLAVTLGYTF